jgi:hypothetical protein
LQGVRETPVHGGQAAASGIIPVILQRLHG